MSSPRKLRSWIGGFLEYTQHIGSPSIYRKWSAIATVSGALERRVTLRTARGYLVPNMFVLLVGPPAIGKSVVIDEVRAMWAGTARLFMAPSSITRAGLIDLLEESKKVGRTAKGEMAVYHPVLVASAEFGNFVPAYENDWINTLNELYDCGKLFEVRTRMHGNKLLEGPYLGIIAGTQPMYLRNLLPEEAFGMGFLSRFILVYSGVSIKSSIFDIMERSGQLESALKHDLLRITEMVGSFRLEEDAKSYYEDQYQRDFPPRPEHPKLQHYIGRRLVHILKVAMCLSASESSDLIITKSHIRSAIATLHEVEKEMPQIFQEMATAGFADVNEEGKRFCMEYWVRQQKPVPHSKLVHFLSGKVPNNQIMATINTMVAAGMLRKEFAKVGEKTVEAYVPLDPKEMLLR
jgi:hypothetical protein